MIEKKEKTEITDVITFIAYHVDTIKRINKQFKLSDANIIERLKNAWNNGLINADSNYHQIFAIISYDNGTKKSQRSRWASKPERVAQKDIPGRGKGGRYKNRGQRRDELLNYAARLKKLKSLEDLEA